MATRIHPKNVHEKSPKNVHEMSPKKRTSCGQKCPQDVTKSVHEKSPFLSTRIHLLCPLDVCHPFWTEETLSLSSGLPIIFSDFNAMEKKVLYGHCPFVFWLFTQLRKRSSLILLCFVWSLITKLSAALFSSSHQTFCLLPLLVRITWCHISINQGLE